MIVSFHQRGTKKFQTFDHYPGRYYIFSDSFGVFYRGGINPQQGDLVICVGGGLLVVELSYPPAKITVSWEITGSTMILTIFDNQYHIALPKKLLKTRINLY